MGRQKEQQQRRGGGVLLQQQQQQPIVRITIGDDSAANAVAALRLRKGTAPSSSSSSLMMMRPPLPPPPRDDSTAPHQLQQQQQEQPPRHLQVGTSEDLSFADFSALDDSFSSEQPTTAAQHHHHHHPNPSLSGFLEDESSPRTVFSRRGYAYNTSNTNNTNMRKVNAVDVASVGNASDTLVSHSSSTNTNQHHTATRELHERAKMAFNAMEYRTALPLFESILTAQVRRFSPLHPSVGAAMHNVGVCRQRLGQHSLAEKLFTEAVQIREQCLGRDHLEVAASLSKLGAAQTAMGKYDEAFDKLRKATKIAVDTLGRQHKTVAQMLCHLACLYFEAGELMSSEATFADALDIYRDVWSTATDRDACMTQLTDTLCNVGSIQNRRKRFGAACESFAEALDLQRGIVNSPNPRDHDARIVSTLDNLGYSYSKLKNYTAALHCYRQMYRTQTSSAASSSSTFTLSCFETLRKQVLMLEKLRRFAEAIDEINAAMHLMSSTLPPRDATLMRQTSDLRDELVLKQQRGADEHG